MQTISKNTLILFTSFFISRFLGFIYLIPYTRIVSKEGLSLFTYAYIPYVFALDLATIGLPIAISRLINKNNNSTYSIMKSSLLVSFILGLLFFILMFIFSYDISSIIISSTDDINSVTKVIKIISFSLILVPFNSVLKGYFQATENMKVVSISNILEQFIRISFMLVSALILYINKFNEEIIIVYSVLATVISALINTLYLLYCFRNSIFYIINAKLFNVFKIIFDSLKLFYFSIFLSLIYLLDSIYFNSYIDNSTMFAIYNFEIKKIINMILIIVNAYVISLLPRLINTKKFYLKQSSFILLLVSIITIIISLISNYIYSFIFSYNELGITLLRENIFIVIFLTTNILVTTYVNSKNNTILYLSLSIGILSKILVLVIFKDLFNNVLMFTISTAISVTFVILINLLYLFFTNYKKSNTIY